MRLPLKKRDVRLDNKASAHAQGRRPQRPALPSATLLGQIDVATDDRLQQKCVGIILLHWMQCAKSISKFEGQVRTALSSVSYV